MNMFSITTQEILERISRHCPDAMSAYLQCLNRSGSDSKVFFSKDFIEVEMSDNWLSFRNKIKKLARENLLEWHPVEDGISVTLADFHEDE